MMRALSDTGFYGIVWESDESTYMDASGKVLGYANSNNGYTAMMMVQVRQ